MSSESINTVDVGTAPREPWIDWIRALGSVGIVALHVTTREKIRRAGDIPPFDWWMLTTYETMTRIAVPLFFMVSGYLCIRRCAELESPEYAWGRGVRIIGITAFWTVIFSFWTMIRGGDSGPLGFILDALRGRPYFHLWFLWALAGIYLLSPILAPGLRMLTARQKVLCGWLLPILVSVDYAFFCLSGQASFFRHSVVSLGVPYAAYTCAGYLLGVGVKKNWPRLCFAIYGAGFVACLCIYGILMKQEMPVLDRVALADSWVFRPFAFPICFMSISSFLLLAKSQIVANRGMPSIVARFARDSMGIYLLHPFVLDVANYFDLFGRRPNALLGVVFVTSLVTLGSWFTTLILGRIPLVKKTISM